MPRLRWLVLLPLLLSPLATSTKMEPHCKDKEMVCFVNTLCGQPAPRTDDELTKTIKNEDCEVHVEIRPYSPKKALIRLRTKSSPMIKLIYDGAPAVTIAGCEEDTNDNSERVVKYIPEDAARELIQSEAIGDTGIACEFLIEGESTFESSKTVNVIYGAGTPAETVKGIMENQLWGTAKKMKTCDIDWLTIEFPVDPKWSYNEPDKRFSEVVCPEGELVFVDDENKVAVAEGGIKCDTAGTAPEYQMLDKKAEVTATADASKDPKAVGCRVAVCKKCKDAPTCPTPPHCPTVDVDVEGCNVLKCSDTKFKYFKPNDADSALAQATCHAGPEENEKPTYRWMLGDTAVTKAACSDKVHCQVMNQLKVEDKDVAGLDLAKRNLTCDSGLIQINGSRTATNIECEETTGEWFAIDELRARTALVKDTAIACAAAKSTTDDRVSGAGALGTLDLVAIGVGSMVLVAVICIIIYCLVAQRRKKKKRVAAAKIQTIKDTSSATNKDDGLKTATPLYPLPIPASSDPPGARKPAEPELVEKTMIAQTPTSGDPKSVVMKTAHLKSETHLPAKTEQVEPQEDDHSWLPKSSEEHRPVGKVYDKGDPELAKELAKGPKGPKEEKSDGSEPKPIRIGKNGEIVHSKGPSGEERSGDKSGHSEAGAAKKDEPPKQPEKKKVDDGPKPRVFPLDAKQEKIRMGAVRKPAEYPTMKDIQSDWDSKKELADEKERLRKLGKSQEGKTVPTAITPDVKPSVERTQDNKTRNTADTKEGKAGDPDLVNLLTQMDTTVEQKEADAAKKK